MSPRASYVWRRLRELGVRGALAKLASRSEGTRRARTQRSADEAQATFAPDPPSGELSRGLTAPKRIAGLEWLEAVCDNYLEHRFDVLGSGWVRLEHGMRCAGLEGIAFDPAPVPAFDPQGAWLRDRVSPANLREARRIWSLLDRDYTPIDWHLDIRSGYRWPETAWYRDVRVAPERGADIKVPWELARCHHLPHLALLACWSPAEDRALLAREFRNQVLDFIATNPPRFGVNWACSMDAGIRVVNWLVAWDLFGAAGVGWDAGGGGAAASDASGASGEPDVPDEFPALLARSVLEHGRHIRDNLEGDPAFRGNHYLADIVGLLFCAAYLPATDETREWWGFARGELFGQIAEQFGADGGNYEASTAYHRLAAEMAIYGTALVVGVDGAEAVPEGVGERLERAAEFVRDTVTPGGAHPRIGDDDSGRLLKLGAHFQWTTRAEAAERFANLAPMAVTDACGNPLPEAHERYWVEDHLDHRHVLAAAVGLIARDNLVARAGDWLDRQLVAVYARGERLAPIAAQASDAAAAVRVGQDGDFERVLQAAAGSSADSKIVQEYEIGVPKPFQLRGYPDFGLYVYRSGDAYLAVRCGPVGQNGRGGHAHNDQLGIVLSADRVEVVVDPGSYLYTPLPERRNEYRSVNAHNAPHVAGREPASLDFDLFRLDDPGAACVYFGERGFAGYHEGYGGVRVWRVIELSAELVRVTDFSDDPTATLVPPTGGPPPAPGYGIRERGGASS